MKTHSHTLLTKSALCALALSLWAPNLFAGSALQTTVQVGSASIQLVAPATYSNYSDENDPVRNLAENFCPPDNRLLGVFGSKAFGRIAAAGEAATDFDYAMVQIPRGAVWLDVSSHGFADVKREIKESQDTLLSEADPDVKEFIARMSRNVEQATGEKFTMKLDEPVSLGVFDESSQHVSMMMLMNMQMQLGETTESVQAAASMSLVHLKGKILFAYAYREYTGEAAVTHLKELSSDWIRQLTAANEQLAAR